METVNYYRQWLETSIELDHAMTAATETENLRRATVAMKEAAHGRVADLMARCSILKALSDAQFEELDRIQMAAEEATIEIAGADAVETAELILAAARKVSERNAIAERQVNVWTYETDSNLPTEWSGRRLTMAQAAQELGLRSMYARPRVTPTWDGYVSFCWDDGRRVVMSGATLDALRDAYRAAPARELAVC